MSDELKRTYHGKEIVSKPADEFVAAGDGWKHEVDGKTFDSLAEAIRHVKKPAKKNPEPKGNE